jgi:hypothetical protein
MDHGIGFGHGSADVLYSRNHSRHPVTVEIGGKTHRGTYWVAGKILTVATGRGGKSRQTGAVANEALAQRLLGKLVEEGKA